MWVVAKVKKNSFNLFKSEIQKKLGNNVKFYEPKIEIHKFFKNKIKKYNKTLLENYIFFYHTNFNDVNLVKKLQFTKGLNFIIDGYKLHQIQIINFINFCKRSENEEGFITTAFFKNSLTKKAQFISGPFTNMFFQILEKQKNKLKILIGDLITIVPDTKNYLYQSV